MKRLALWRLNYTYKVLCVAMSSRIALSKSTLQFVVEPVPNEMQHPGTKQSLCDGLPMVIVSHSLISFLSNLFHQHGHPRPTVLIGVSSCLIETPPCTVFLEHHGSRLDALYRALRRLTDSPTVNHTTDEIDLSILGDTPHGSVEQQILHKAWACLSCDHRRILKRFLAKLSTIEMTRLMTRLCSLGVDQYCRFIAMLSETTYEQFSRYLNFFVAPPYPLWADDPQTSPMIDTPAIIPKAARMGLNSTATSEAGIEHQNLFNIPQEILDMTLDNLFHAVFIPGVLQPADYPSFDGPDCFVDKSFGLLKSRTFRSIDPVRFNRYKEDYWTKNTWVRLSLTPPP